ncbi:hypothetical protein EDB89DRAFT_1908811 [Lactarius sanguifluus]|nr:hypothetical protein EDB89DRAFT_1908811 [Lactarius sanguifluus]
MSTDAGPRGNHALVTVFEINKQHGIALKKRHSRHRPERRVWLRLFGEWKGASKRSWWGSVVLGKWVNSCVQRLRCAAHSLAFESWGLQTYFVTDGRATVRERHGSVRQYEPHRRSGDDCRINARSDNARNTSMPLVSSLAALVHTTRRTDAELPSGDKHNRHFITKVSTCVETLDPPIPVAPLTDGQGTGNRDDMSHPSASLVVLTKSEMQGEASAAEASLNFHADSEVLGNPMAQDVEPSTQDGW